MSVRVTLIRHGRSEANEANLWQGQGDSALSQLGREQVAALAGRLGGHRFDHVVASDLARARETGEALGHPTEVDPAWREMDLGGWEGRTFEEVAAQHPDLLEAIRNGEAVSFGGTGETIADFEARVMGALAKVVAHVGEGSIAIATHGGVIDAVVGSLLGRVRGRRTFPIVTNTSLTVLEGDPHSLRLARFNDATHLGVDVGFLGRMRDDGIPVVTFVRHGVTAANKAGRVQGQSCWGLDPEGHLQAKMLARWYPKPDRLISSPLQRAMETAAAFGVPIVEDPAIMEMSFGSWEGRNDLAGDDWATRIYDHGEDLPRGRDGETFAQVVERMCGFLSRIDAQPDRRTVAVSHGAAIRAVIAGIHGRGNDINRNLGVAPNSSITHVVMAPGGPVVADYGLAPHLETM